MAENLPLASEVSESDHHPEAVVAGAECSAEVGGEDLSSCACDGVAACYGKKCEGGCICHCDIVPPEIRQALEDLLCAWWAGSSALNKCHWLAGVCDLVSVSAETQTGLENWCNVTKEKTGSRAYVSQAVAKISSEDGVHKKSVIDFLCRWLTLDVEDEEYCGEPFRTLIARFFYLLILQSLADSFPEETEELVALRVSIGLHAGPLVMQILTGELEYVIYTPIRHHFLEIFREIVELA